MNSPLTPLWMLMMGVGCPAPTLHLSCTPLWRTAMEGKPHEKSVKEGYEEGASPSTGAWCFEYTATH